MRRKNSAGVNGGAEGMVKRAQTREQGPPSVPVEIFHNMSKTNLSKSQFSQPHVVCPRPAVQDFWTPANKTVLLLRLNIRREEISSDFYLLNVELFHA